MSWTFDILSSLVGGLALCEGPSFHFSFPVRTLLWLPFSFHHDRSDTFFLHYFPTAFQLNLPDLFPMEASPECFPPFSSCLPLSVMLSRADCGGLFLTVD